MMITLPITYLTTPVCKESKQKCVQISKFKSLLLYNFKLIKHTIAIEGVYKVLDGLRKLLIRRSSLNIHTLNHTSDNFM